MMMGVAGVYFSTITTGLSYRRDFWSSAGAMVGFCHLGHLKIEVSRVSARDDGSYGSFYF
jgi:hypothetical protein